jgi:hypothetical protein
MSDYNLVKNQNIILETNLQDLNDYETKFTRQSFFGEKNIPLLNTINTYLFYTYFVLVFIILLLSYNTKTRGQFVAHLLMTAALAVFPFFIYSVELVAFNTISFISAVLLGNPYIPKKTLFPEPVEINARDQKPTRSINIFSSSP